MSLLGRCCFGLLFWRHGVYFLEMGTARYRISMELRLGPQHNAGYIRGVWDQFVFTVYTSSCILAMCTRARRLM